MCIGWTPEKPDMAIFINGRRIGTDSNAQSVAVLVATYLCFNLVHPKSQESVLEAVEGLVGLRGNFL